MQLLRCGRQIRRDAPVARLSTDRGQTFGPVLRLATNGTISSTNDETTTAAGEEGESEQQLDTLDNTILEKR